MIGPKEKRERAVGERLNLKGERCATPKCAMVRKPYRPGVHGQQRHRRALSEFGLQLKEKQKFKLSYGLDERNLRQIFVKAVKAKGSSAAKMVEFLERRLDNVIFRLGFASSRGSARQLIVHGHVSVNNRRVRSPGYAVKTGDIITTEGDIDVLKKRKEILRKYEPPAWLHLDKEKLEGRVLSPPQNETPPFEINLVIEAFSK